MGTAKRGLQAQLDRIVAIEAITIAVKAVEYDETKRREHFER